MRSYEAARGSFNFFEQLARIVIGVGVLAAVAVGALAAESMGRNVPQSLAIALGALPGGFVALAGFFGLAMAQMGRATVDSAEYAQQALSVSRQQLELSQEALVQGKATAASYAELLKRQPMPTVQISEPVTEAQSGPSYADKPDEMPETKAPQPQLIEHAGYQITHDQDLYVVDERTFKTEEAAKAYIEKMPRIE
jgi:hypothetical protein